MFEQLYLASASPRRQELLSQIGVRYAVYPVDLDESEAFGESPQEYVSRLAIGKAAAGWDKTQSLNLTPLPVLGADTVVVFDGEIWGKPVNRDDGISKLLALSGNLHTVMTAIAVQFEHNVEYRLCCTDVVFKSIPRELAERYWETGEPLDKAGGYGIQGYGAIFVERIEGSYSGVVGLPLTEVAALLERFNVKYWN